MPPWPGAAELKLVADCDGLAVWQGRCEGCGDFVSPARGEYALLLVACVHYSAGERDRLAQQLMEKCRYAVIYGVAGDEWHDALDDALDDALVGSIDEQEASPFVMTDDFSGQSLESAVQFFVLFTGDEDWSPKDFVVVTLEAPAALEERLSELLSEQLRAKIEFDRE